MILEFVKMGEGFNSEFTPFQLKEYLISINPRKDNDYIDHLSPYHLLLAIPLAGCYHFIFNKNCQLQKVYYNIGSFSDKIHTIILWKRHFWTI